ncbi:aspartyl-phosphate phosphatase Spo0E family protein [Virgibacillus soli]|uniref:Aspartyl-phosphate phosphatase Spo0E family protein n=1 Tax=Paracerasibacillus soli TaxID=480284 RepID=A0ABU5CQ98_9BACI|nr:aspartyl-phosphate phosphatase Spo0E family protein [Virgibacillus soli]MDY0408041.1 aspartyl-phosphate phosphatase Spo0E family protein [Virgibacillus soli]
MASTNKLLMQIEDTRKRMTAIAIEKGLTNPESLKLSEELDYLLNKFEQLKGK